MATDLVSTTTANAEEEKLQLTWTETAVTWIVVAAALLIVSWVSVLMGKA